MKIRTKIFLGNLIIILAAIPIGAFFIFESSSIANLVQKEMPGAVKNISNSSYLDSLAQYIKYYDEVLTQSARNYAFTGDKKWKERYNSVVKDLDIKIKEAIEKGDSVEKDFFSRVNSSNNALIALEEKSFSLVDSGDKKGAINILEGSEYSNQKKIYSDALSQYLNLRGSKYQEVLVVSTKSVENISNNVSSSIYRLSLIILMGIISWMIMAVFVTLYFSRTIIKPLIELKLFTSKIIGGKLDEKVIIKSKDEFRDLADSFNTMSQKLKESIDGVEQKIKDRTKELESLNKYMVGRELKMVDLKKRINDLEKNK